ncbi:GNAT family N-acetyltransferase [Brevibacillus fluminis]|uniref:GNAT family N-acetyltransferase n=1 Tax=Brevibacillus fluminis TaxID=511487 RepID=UPI003F8C8152
MYELLTITELTVKKFITLASGKAKVYIQKPDAHWIGFGIEFHDEPVGLVVAAVGSSGRGPTILCLHVVEEHRNRGLEQRLLDQIEHALLSRGHNQIKMEYLKVLVSPSGSAGNEFDSESVFLQNGWSPFTSKVEMYTLSGEHLEDCNWIPSIRLPSGFSVSPWEELSVEERQVIQNGKENWYPADLCPFFEEDKNDPHFSLLLRYKENIIGWLIAQRVARNMIYYKVLFVRQQYRQLGRGISLLGIGLKRASEGGFAYAMFSIDRENIAMSDFVRKRLAHLVIGKKVLRVSEKVY